MKIVSTKWGSYVADPMTGLPVVAGGYFWRVTKPDCIGMHEIQLRHKRLVGSSLVGYALAHPGELSEREIQDRAAYVWIRKLNRDERYLKRSRVSVRADLVGDYPPKNLDGRAEQHDF